MRIPSGTTDQYIYFVAVDSTDLKSRETGLTGFTVYWSRNGGAATQDASVTVNEVDATNMPGVYEYLVTEGTTIDAGDDSQEYVLHITHASMAPVTRVIEIYRPKITVGNTLGVAADGDISGNVDGAVGSVTGNVGGNVVGSVANVTGGINTAAGTITTLDGLDTAQDSQHSTTQSNIAALNDLDAAGVATAVWNAATATYGGAGTYGQAVEDVLDDTGTSGVVVASGTVTTVSGNVNGSVGSVTGGINTAAGTLTTLDGLDTAQDSQHASTQADIAALNDPTVAAIADAVWDEVITGVQHNVPTSAARYLREAAQATGLSGTAQSATTSTLVLASGAVTADDIMNGEVVFIIDGTGAGQARVITDSVASTDTITVLTNWTTTPDSTSIYSIRPGDAVVRQILDQAVAATATVDFDDLDAILTDTAAMGTTVNTEVSDVLKTDTISEMSQQAPPATPTFEEAIMYLYMALRNKLDVDTTGGTDYKEFYNDAGTVIWKKAVSDDGSTYTEAEGITGP